MAGTRDQEIKALQQSVVDAQADLALKKADSDRAQQLFSKDELSAQDRDRAATAVKRSEASAERRATTRSAKPKRAPAKKTSPSRAPILNQAEANLGLSRINAGYTTLRAPAAGVITVRQAELGEVVAPGTPVVSVADLDHIWLRSYVAETDLGRIHWGQDATVTTDTYPGKQYHGRISFIAPNAEFTPKSVQTYKERVTLVYRIKIDIDNPNHELKPGMPADAHMQLAAGAKRKSTAFNIGKVMTDSRQHESAIAIKAEGLTKSFPGVRAVDGLSFDVRAGEIFGLVGPDGAGKTTTLRMLAGIMPPDAGKATVAGCDVVRDPERAKHDLSYMPQRFGLYEDLTVDENIRFYADLFGVRKGRAQGSLCATTCRQPA